CAAPRPLEYRPSRNEAVHAAPNTTQDCHSEKFTPDNSCDKWPQRFTAQHKSYQRILCDNSLSAQRVDDLTPPKPRPTFPIGNGKSRGINAHSIAGDVRAASRPAAVEVPTGGHHCRVRHRRLSFLHDRFGNLGGGAWLDGVASVGPRGPRRLPH